MHSYISIGNLQYNQYYSSILNSFKRFTFVFSKFRIFERGPETIEPLLLVNKDRYVAQVFPLFLLELSMRSSGSQSILNVDGPFMSIDVRWIHGFVRKEKQAAFQKGDPGDLNIFSYSNTNLKTMEFLKYLQNTKESIKSIHLYNKIHIVIGNESCDLDSTVSSLILAYFLYKHNLPEISESELIIPVLNVSHENFFIHLENCFVLQECGIPLETLVYRDQLDIADILKTTRVTTSLVDHHVLSKHDQILESTVTQIFDHRPIDPSTDWNKRNVKLKIEEVGSCSTLIAAEIFKVDENILSKEMAYLIYETMIYDTVALLPENGRAKELDLTIAKKLEEKFSFTEGRIAVFEKILEAHNNVSQLTPSQMLMKDLKIVDNIPVPGLPMLVQNFLKIDAAYNAIENFASDYNSSLVVLIGLEITNGVQRDVGVYWKQGGEDLKDIVVDKLKRSEELKGYNFCFSEVCLGYKNIICLKQNNIKLTRKQIVPLIRDAVTEYTKRCVK